VQAIVAAIKDGSSPTAQRRTPKLQPDPAAEESHHESLILRRAANAIQALPLAPSGFVSVDTPILIWEVGPHYGPHVFADGEYTPGDAGLRFNVEDRENAFRTFAFYYIWENPSEFFAVVNVATSLLFTGVCTARSATGFFTGESSLFFSCGIEFIRNSGWGNDPITNNPTDGTVYPAFAATTFATVANLTASDIFEGSGFLQREFSGTPFDLSYQQMVVPGGASVLFEVMVQVLDTVSSAETANSTSLDFATGDNRVACPGIELEILTPEALGVTGLTLSGDLVTQPLR
jgi:hypothetical protein